MSPGDTERMNDLVETRQRNNDAAWMICDYLNDHPRAITKALMEDVGHGGALPEEIAFFALLTGFCGLDSDADERDKQLANDYFRPAIKRLDTDSYGRNPYYRDISIPEIGFGDWELKYDKYEPYEAFIYDDLVVDEDFKEVPRIGFFSEEFHFPAVAQNGHEWMAIKPNEIETMRSPIDTVEGEVVTFGLGLGYFAYMASIKERVRSITVVERDREVIQLFERHILPQFRHRDKIEIVSADAFEYAERRMPGKNFDYAFVDLWHDASDGLALYLMMKKLERFNPRTKFLYWIEESLLSSFRWQLFDSLIRNARSYDEIAQCLGKPFLRKIAATNR